ncbi:MAG: DUF501 domain-containing protein [Synergistaceae bacterium]|nr:DUF501 domain-containing protein [Synergistaceae bacterium]
MHKQIISGGCLRASPVFHRDILELEGRYSDSKQKFDASLIAGCVRCRFGKVQVLVCRPFSVKMRPFPTTFWLVCPYLTHRAGMLESRGGVRELEASITDFREWRRYNILHQEIRLNLMEKFALRAARKYQPKIFRSVMRSGIGGMKQAETVSVKCLHLQTASFIALGKHPGSDWLERQGLGARGQGLCSDCGGDRSYCQPCSL